MRPHVIGLSHDTTSQRAVHEVFFHREIRQSRQRQILRINEALNMCELAVWSVRAKAHSVIDADFLVRLIVLNVPKLAVIPTHLTEAAFIIGTLLLFLGGARLRLLRVSIDALSVLLVTDSIFLEKLTYGNPLLNVHVQVFTVIALRAHFFKPIHAYLLFQLCTIRYRFEGSKYIV